VELEGPDLEDGRASAAASCRYPRARSRRSCPRSAAGAEIAALKRRRHRFSGSRWSWRRGPASLLIWASSLMPKSPDRRVEGLIRRLRRDAASASVAQVLRANQTDHGKLLGPRTSAAVGTEVRLKVTDSWRGTAGEIVACNIGDSESLGQAARRYGAAM